MVTPKNEERLVMELETLWEDLDSEDRLSLVDRIEWVVSLSDRVQ